MADTSDSSIRCWMKTSHKNRDVVVIGGSAGALETLRLILARLPADLPASIFVTIHIPSDFPSYLPEILSSAGPLKTIHPSDKDPIKKGTIYVAPADYHLLVEKGCVRISRGPRENRHRPAIDPLFRSAARSYGNRVIGVILSGQLDDGSSGLMAVKMRGGLTIVQSPDEALSPEMPNNAIAYAKPDQILRAEEIAAFLTQAVTEPLRTKNQMQEVPLPNGIEDEAREANLEEESPKKKLGNPSEFACPECHGVLWELDEGGHLRFRCRVGHAYTADALRVAMSEGCEDALWAAMRALEEKAALLRRMAPRSGEKLAKKYLEEAHGYDKHVETIRRILVENQGLEIKEHIQTDVA